MTIAVKYLGAGDDEPGWFASPSLHLSALRLRFRRNPAVPVGC